MQTGLLHRFNLTGALKPLLLSLFLLINITTYSQTASSNRFKRIDYEYDLVSGKVNKVSYQKDSADQFIHQYSYDSDNRITKVETSSDNVVWDVDAKYFYYAHGPLARTEIGNDKVQGIDYAYTLQGWIKGVNSNTLDKKRDMGQDGKDTSIYDPSNPQLHANFAQDAFGYSLNYFKGDYKAINQVRWNNATNRFEAVTTGSELMQQTHDLYNGNIKSMVTAITQIDTTSAGNVNPQIPKPLGNAYKYDQLNRIKKSVSYTNINLVGNLWQSSGQTIANIYGNTFSYDANGNILTQNRSDENGQEFEALNYKYRTLAGNLRQNRLYHVNDNISYTSLKTDDIDDQGRFANGSSSSPLIDSVGQFNNYSYDNIGNLVKDKAEQIASIEWTVYGKVKKITRSSGSTRDNIIFDYDPMGNRIAKHVYDNANNWKYTTYYVRDAQGNIMGTYEHKNIPPPGGIGSPSMSFVLQEQHIYGSSRLGMNTPNKELIETSNSLSNLTHTIGKKYFEITNHLGSVTTVISDRKIPIGTGSAIAFYQSDIISSTDFAVFGAPLSARDFSSSKYNFGFGGQLKDNNISGDGNSYSAEYWQFDSRLGRRWNIDPKPTATEGVYTCISNNPVWKTDIYGDTTYIYNAKGIYKGVILDKLKTNEIVVMSDLNANAIMNLQAGGKYSSEIVAGVARDPKFADARFTENTVKELTKFSTSSSQESAGLIYVDKQTKEVKADNCESCKKDPKDITAAGEADPVPLGELEKTTGAKGKIIGVWHTHPENTFAGTQPSDPDYSANGYVNSLQGGGIGLIVNDKSITLYQLYNYTSKSLPQSSENAKNDNVLKPKFPKGYSGNVISDSQKGVFNKKLSPQTTWKK